MSRPLADMAQEIRVINAANGWNVLVKADWGDSQYKIPAILALIHSEVSEALEAFRKGDKENFAEELADILIRTLDCAGGVDMDIDGVVASKLDANRKRAWRHGGKRL